MEQGGATYEDTKERLATNVTPNAYDETSSPNEKEEGPAYKQDSTPTETYGDDEGDKAEPKEHPQQLQPEYKRCVLLHE